MSDDELKTLSALSRIVANLPDDDSRKFCSTHVSKIAQELGGITEQDVIVLCEGLLQLSLVLDSWTGKLGHDKNNHQNWRTTTLARQVMEFAKIEAS